MTAAGRVTLTRRSARCPDCGLSAYPADARLGLDGFLSPRATRLACLAAASWSFDVASDRLEEIAGLRIDDETIRRHCHQAAAELPDRRQADPPRAPFAAARGDIEFLTDGVMAPIRRQAEPPAPADADARGDRRALADDARAPAGSAWKEVKMALFQVRPRGEPAGVDRWAARELPAPTASVAYATTQGCDEFSARWPGWAQGLGIDPEGPLSVLGDGAPWIWAATAEHFPAAEQVLDIFHGCQHLAAAADALYGKGSEASADWLDRGRARLLADGWPGLLDHLGATPVEGRTEAGQAALDGLIGYFAKHTGRVGYFGRLRTGRSIGSGAVEGLARRMGRRLKVPGRGWCEGHIEGMAALITALDTPEWPCLWARPAA